MTAEADRPQPQFTRIPLSDGGFLATTLYLPAAATVTSTGAAPGESDRVPCLLEALPYRKDDLTASYRPEYVRFRDEHGYAVARIDLRGSGSSPGVMLDEYHPSEQADLVEAIAWLAEQPWCTGAVGMFGTSWSGFNALQLACERPPALRAIVATYASDDRWTDDVHYCGGALRWLDQIDYPLYMVAMGGLPPVPALYGEDWRAEWLRRARGTPPWLIGWLEAQADGPSWRQGSLRPAYQRIGCPTMLVAGWADGYSNLAFRAFEALHDAGTPVHVLAGPWSHQSPATAVPGPRVDHVPVMARWWDRWLRGTPNGVERQPPFAVFVRGYAPPEPDALTWPGRWEAHDAASLAARRPVELPLASARIGGGLRDGDLVEYQGDPDVGPAGWNSCAGSLPWGQPLDQTPDDARSLSLEWDVDAPPLAGAVVLGHPRLRLRVRPDAKVAFVSAKLSLVPASGRPSLLVDRGLLNLAYRDGVSTRPRACVPGEWVDVEVELDACAFEPASTGRGGRLRLALACADWPNVVAAPGVWSAVDLAASALVLPVSAGTPHPSPALPAPASEPEPEPTPEATQAEEPGESSHVECRHGYDVLTRTTSADVDHGSRYGGNFGARCTEHYLGHVEIDRRTALQTATATARYTLTWPAEVGGGEPVTATSEARLVLTADAENFDVQVELDVTDGATALVAHRWRRRIPRRLA
jgi:uncharacterized protein